MNGYPGGGWRATATAMVLALSLVRFAGAVATNYVTPTGGGAFDGSSWENARSNIQEAIDACPDAGSVLFLKEGVYSNTASLAISNHPGLTIRGGYEGVGAPGDFADTPSILTRDTNVAMRILSGFDSTVTLDRVTVSNGLALLGGGAYLTNCYTLVTNCTIANNMIVNNNARGGGVYAMGGNLTVIDSLVKENADSAYHSTQHGAGLYVAKAIVVISDVTFEKNALSGYISEYGGALYVNGGTATVFNCTFISNSVITGHSGGEGAFGGAVYASAATLLTFSNCVFLGNYAYISLDPAKCYGNAFNFYNVAQARIEDCVIRDNYTDGVLSPDIWIDSNGSTVIENSRLGAGSGRGIYKKGTGSLALTNCLIHVYPGHGIEAGAGSIALANCTLADNGGWGLAAIGAVATVRDSIAWGNTGGGLSTNDAVVAYTCSQEAHAGTGNQNADPLWIAGYYLSAAGLGYQPVNSPCVNAGSDTAAALGLNGRTTRTDGAADGDQVDLGYHTTGGAVVSNRLLYVDALNGNDANTGWTPDVPLKTIACALAKAVDNATITLATGLYNQASGEVFPLTLKARHLTVKGTNRADTAIDAGGAAGVFQAFNMGRIRFENLVVTNGLATAPGGGGFNLNLCDTVISNCTIIDNKLAADSVAGGGIYLFRGSLLLADSWLQGNGQLNSKSSNIYGGGLAATKADVVVVDTIFHDNPLLVYATGKGGAIYLIGGSATIRDCEFRTNRVHVAYGWSANTVYGGALYASAVDSLVVSNCLFIQHQLSVPSKLAYGSVLAIENKLAANRTLIEDCVLSNNVGKTIADDVHLACVGPVAIRHTRIGNGFSRGIYKSGAGSMALTNCLVEAQPSNGVEVAAGSVTVVNTTLARNGGWGLTNTDGTVSLLNCIAWGNTNGGVSANCDLTYTCSQEAHAGAGNRNEDPLFRDAAAGDYRLTAASTCINAGLNEAWMAQATDLDGERRLRGGTVDLGAYEAPGPRGSLLMVR